MIKDNVMHSSIFIFHLPTPYFSHHAPNMEGRSNKLVAAQIILVDRQNRGASNAHIKYITVSQCFLEADTADLLDHQIITRSKICESTSTAINSPSRQYGTE
jgi:hypothetical protein